MLDDLPRDEYLHDKNVAAATRRRAASLRVDMDRAFTRRVERAIARGRERINQASVATPNERIGAGQNK
jgi:hypothetical protein